LAKITIDGKDYDVDPNQNLLHAGLSLGLDIPYFCWHPAMGSVGACRQCAVKQYQDENDTRGRIVMACMTPATEGTRISILDEEAADFRARVIEWLMINHPHDCPVCDEGGECHLQDMTLMTGHAYRRHRFTKRTYRNQYLGPFVNHEMNRCIQCYRCVRYYRDMAGGRDLDVFGAHDNVYFGRHQDGILESEFSGNLVEVCPTGVFTDKTLKKHYTRKWDLQTAPSVCVHCGVGCNTIPGERYNEIRRIHNRYNREVNGYFLCDRGRYGYEFLNHERRIYQPLIRSEQEHGFQAVTPDIVRGYLTRNLKNSAKAIGVGSPRASLESNYALRELVGEDCFFAGISSHELQLVASAVEILQNSPARSPSLHEIELADAVLVLGEDLTNTAPMMAFAIRQAVRRKPMEIPEKLGIHLWNDYAVRDAIQDLKGPLVIASPMATKLDDVATETFHGSPDDLARLGFAIANAVDPGAPEVSGISDSMRQLADNMARALLEAESPVVISGPSLGNLAVMQAAANVARALALRGKPAGLSFTMPECNSLGLALMGGDSLEAALQTMQNGDANTVIILENDLYRHAEAALVDELLDSAETIIVIDHIHQATSEAADVILPAATFAEGDGTLVNNEGRAQRYFQVFVPEHGQVQESWRWLQEISTVIKSRYSKSNHRWNHDEVMRALAADLPVFASVQDIAPPEGFRLAQQKIPRKPHRYSGRTAVNAHRTVHEPKPPDDPDAPYNFSMEGFKGQIPGAWLPRYWAPNWNSVQALNKFQTEVAGPLQGGDPGRRLIEPGSAEGTDYFRQVPEAFVSREGQWLVVPLYHIFGSEELSFLSPSIVQLSPSPYIAINPQDGERMKLTEGSEVDVKIGETRLRLPGRYEPSLPPGMAGLPAGLVDIPRIDLPAWGEISVS
jgi:NADH-quinone oxidoreductase subunit G